MKTLKSVFFLICALISISISKVASWKLPGRLGERGVIGKNGNKAQGHQCTLQAAVCSTFSLNFAFSNTRRMDSTSAHSTVMQRDAKIRDINIGQAGLDLVMFC